MADLYFVSYELLVFFILYYFCRDELLKWFTRWTTFIYTYYAFIGIRFNIDKAHDIFVTAIYIIFLTVLAIYYLKKKILKKHLTWKSILTILIFVISLVLHKILSNYGLPWFIGYILVTLSFIIGLILYRKELRFRKKQ